ncbi:DUF1648 domain-containing protein [Rhodococcus sp. NPDC058521]|uniref:DUF1648 domain-containing protein n=1 Tax=Rhodococcus sp. NPDC058521 TaxID=3346536 RepID=UPI0036471FD6
MSSRRIVDPGGALFGLLLPALAAVGGTLLTKIWEPRLPAEIATHWTTTSPDGFAPPMSSAWAFAIVILLIGGGCCSFASLAGGQLLIRRIMLLIGLTVVGLTVTVQVTLLTVQLDETSGADTELPTSAMGLGMLIGTALGLVGAAALRDYRVRVPATKRPDPDLPRRPTSELPVTDDVGFGAVGSGVLILLVVAPALWLSTVVGTWWILAVFVPILLLILAVLRFRVIVDGSGIRVVNMGMTSIAYGIDEVEGVRVDEIKPFDDFGGWGLKTKGPRNYGVVTRSGPALILTTACGDRLTVTSPKAEEMAGVLNSLADQRATYP